MSIILLLLFLLNNNNIFSQTYERKTISFKGILSLDKAIGHANGFLIIGKAYLNNKDGTSLHINKDQVRLLLINLSYDGSILWSKKLRLSALDHIIDAVIDIDGNILILTSIGEYLNKNDMYYPNNTCLLKMDVEGNELWREYYSGLSTSIICTSDRNYVIASFPEAKGERISRFKKKGCLRKIDKKGEIIWEKCYFPDEGTGRLDNYFKIQESKGGSIVFLYKRFSSQPSQFKYRNSGLWYQYNIMVVNGNGTIVSDKAVEVGDVTNISDWKLDSDSTLCLTVNLNTYKLNEMLFKVRDSVFHKVIKIDFKGEQIASQDIFKSTKYQNFVQEELLVGNTACYYSAFELNNEEIRVWKLSFLYENEPYARITSGNRLSRPKIILHNSGNLIMIILFKNVNPFERSNSIYDGIYLYREN